VRSISYKVEAVELEKLFMTCSVRYSTHREITEVSGCILIQVLFPMVTYIKWRGAPTPASCEGHIFSPKTLDIRLKGPASAVLLSTPEAVGNQF
jgi:hypothetical protein